MEERVFKPINNKITIYAPGGEKIYQQEGNLFVYYDDMTNFNILHFKDEEGRHHRIAGNGGMIIIEEA